MSGGLLVEHGVAPAIVDGKSVMVDVGIVDLIETMNAIPGLKTLYSCQGDPWHPAYVMFIDESPHTFGVALRFLQEVIAHMALAEYGPVSGSVTLSLYFTVEVCASGFVIRWFPEMLPTLLHIVRTISEQMRRDGTSGTVNAKEEAMNTTVQYSELDHAAADVRLARADQLFRLILFKYGSVTPKMDGWIREWLGDKDVAPTTPAARTT